MDEEVEAQRGEVTSPGSQSRALSDPEGSRLPAPLLPGGRGGVVSYITPALGQTLLLDSW